MEFAARSKRQEYSGSRSGCDVSATAKLVDARARREWRAPQCCRPRYQCSSGRSVRTGGFQDSSAIKFPWWQQAVESTVDPANPNGPLCFTSASPLALAYARMHMNFGPMRELGSGSSDSFALGVSIATLLERTEELSSALLHSAHALNIIVEYGIDWVSRSRFLHIGAAQLLYYPEAACFFSYWPLTISNNAHQVHVTGRCWLHGSNSPDSP
jgi:hypothetical protein